MAANDEVVLLEFTRTRLEGTEIVLEVQTITWQDPHSPNATWAQVDRLPAFSDESAISRHLRKLLQDHRFFRVCKACGDRNPVGWMLDEGICHRCAAARGVVF